MTDYNYLNARMKSLKRGLFSKGKLDELLALKDFEEVKRFFLDSPYGSPVGESLAQYPGELGLERGLSRHIHKTFQEILEWSGACPGGTIPQAREEPRRLLELFLRRYDLHNIKTLLRGKNRKLPSEKILETLIPVGGLALEELSELSKQPSLRETVVLLATWRQPLKRVLRRNLASLKEEPVDLRGVEAELDHYYYEGILSALAEEKGEDAVLVKKFIQIEIDTANVLSLLRLKELPRNELSRLLLDGGLLGKGFLLSLSANLKPVELIQRFEMTYLARVLTSWRPEGGLTDLERRFEMFLLHVAQRMEREDPLSIGVAISYFARLSQELKKIRLILQGKFFALNELKLKEELLLV